MMDGSPYRLTTNSVGLTRSPRGRAYAQQRAKSRRETLCCQRVVSTQGMPDVAPYRLHISRHYGLIRSTERPARRMGDLCRQVSWLAARASLSGLPGGPTWIASGIFGEDLPLTVAGAASASSWRRSAASHRVPFSLSTRSRTTREPSRSLERRKSR
jgi:hypothetical protein